jgi:hypothetical protein
MKTFAEFYTQRESSGHFSKQGELVIPLKWDGASRAFYDDEGTPVDTDRELQRFLIGQAQAHGVREFEVYFSLTSRGHYFPPTSANTPVHAADPGDYDQHRKVNDVVLSVDGTAIPLPPPTKQALIGHFGRRIDKIEVGH